MMSTEEKEAVPKIMSAGPVRPEEKEAEQYYVPEKTKMRRKK